MDSVGRVIQGAIYRAGALGRRPVVPVSPGALEAAARKAMSPEAFAYVAGSAGLESTERANRDAFDAWRIVPRMLVDVSKRSAGITLFGREHPTPFLVAPIGVQEMAHPEADLATARAASALQVPMIFSTQASVPMEQTAAAMGETEHWYQLYWSSNDELVASFVGRAEKAGAQAIVVTLDTQVLGWRTRDLDLAYLPFARGLGIAQYTSDPVFTRLVEERAKQPFDRPRPSLGAIRTLLSLTKHYPGDFRSNLRSPLPRAAVDVFLDVFSRPSLTWSDLATLRDMTSLPVVLKGLQHPEDATKALDAGVDGIIVSNHGGRQVDGAVGSARALPEIVAEVNGRVPVLFDSGIRGGADAFKALALGATAVCIGRPYVYGLALAGEQGVRAVLEHHLAELDLTMALAGTPSIADITAAALSPAADARA